MEGYVGLFRCLLEKPIWKRSTPEQKTILVTLLLMVNHKEAEWEWKGKKFKLHPGQTITSLDKIVEAAGKGITIQNVRTALTRFEKLEFLTNESTKTGRLVTIVNWGLYQNEFKKTNKDDNKDLTKSQQRPNKGLTPNKNDNNNNNDNNNKKLNKYMSDSNEYRLAEYLYKHILKNNPKAKEPIFQTWSKHFDYILRIDKRDLEEVKKIIKFSQTDSFWLKNILSPEKLRKQYDRLVLEMKQPKVNSYSKKESTFNNFKQRDYDFDDLKNKLTENINDELKPADCKNCVVWQKGACFLKKTPDGNNMCDGFKPKS